jgi:hypothetical protein
MKADDSAAQRHFRVDESLGRYKDGVGEVVYGCQGEKL